MQTPDISGRDDAELGTRGNGRVAEIGLGNNNKGRNSVDSGDTFFAGAHEAPRSNYFA